MTYSEYSATLDIDKCRTSIEFLMPTQKKRVGFIPREDVLKIIKKLSIENNLSNSKIISILVEEALSVRGIFNKKDGKATQLFHMNSDNSKDFSEQTIHFKDNEKITINTKLRNHKDPRDTTVSKKTNQEDFDLQTYQKYLSFLKFQKMMDK